MQGFSTSPLPQQTPSVPNVPKFRTMGTLYPLFRSQRPKNPDDGSTLAALSTLCVYFLTLLKRNTKNKYEKSYNVICCCNNDGCSRFLQSEH